ncbi:MAG: zinc ribbon domain-containing protein [Candidatus Heimdallarchaeota archaeon]|nr:zinc ribbon domain-containing protein [Candidatus Heimdallarchaeota archaeon]
MTSHETDEYKSTKRKLKTISFILLTVGGLLIVIGGMSILTSFSSFPDMNSMDSFQLGEFIGGFAVGGFALVIGFAMFAFGIQLFMTANARAIAKYAATETAPAVSITTEAVASGLSKGLKGSGVGLGSSDREVIKIKCRNCGYLETEDADFCSKCGERM